jgi:pyruvate formate lyase activating enzyme
MQRIGKKEPLILDIKGNSLDDGPGIRSVIFFKGCPLDCVWCHNPESKKAGVEISYDARACIGCGACREVCRRGALSPDNTFFIDREICDLCFACVDACPSGALDRVGKRMSLSEILERVLPDKPFYDTSGGGVTLSGGEPTLYPGFVSRLLITLKELGIRTLIETCGHFDPDGFMESLYPHVDLIYFDIKLMDRTAHKAYCGRTNERILDNFKLLAEASRKDGKHLLARTPLIPGITDTPENVLAIARFLKELGIKEASLLPYNPLWHEKSAKVGAVNPYRSDKAMTAFSDRAVLERCKAVFADAGISC